MAAPSASPLACVCDGLRASLQPTDRLPPSDHLPFTLSALLPQPSLIGFSLSNPALDRFPEPVTGGLGPLEAPGGMADDEPASPGESKLPKAHKRCVNKECREVLSLATKVRVEAPLLRRAVGVPPQRRSARHRPAAPFASPWLPPAQSPPCPALRPRRCSTARSATLCSLTTASQPSSARAAAAATSPRWVLCDVFDAALPSCSASPGCCSVSHAAVNIVLSLLHAN